MAKSKRRRTCVIDGRLRRESVILRDWFENFNESFFNNRLPKDTFLFWDTNIGGQDAYGRWYCAEEVGSGFPAIAIMSYLRGKSVHAGTLLHEMIHVKIKGGHNRRFERERKRILKYKDVRDIVI